VVFDICIDGKPATSRTFIGGSLSRPASMPFVEGPAGETVTVEGRPEEKPVPPYCLIWLDRPSYGDQATVELDEATRRELRSLGYIQ
jgi:hypothetical protein